MPPFVALVSVESLVAKAIARVLDAMLENVGLDRAVEQDGMKRALDRGAVQGKRLSVEAPLLHIPVHIAVGVRAFG